MAAKRWFRWAARNWRIRVLAKKCLLARLVARPRILLGSSTAGPVETAVTANSLGLLAPSDKSAMVGYGSFAQTVDALEYAVDQGGPWLLGEQFTAADVYVGSQVAWGLMFKTLPERPAFQAYAGRLMSRPAAVRAREIDDALIAEMKAGA